MTVDVHEKLADLRRKVEDARSMPMSASAMVNRGELLSLVDELSSAMRSALTDADEVVSERDELVKAGRQEAERIVAAARVERESIITDTDVLRAAEQEAARIVEKAKNEADALRAESDDYVDAKLANFEITLERTSEAVRRGRERLAGGTTFDGITAAEADKITLPPHLED